MIHQKYDRNFRLSAWPFAPGAELSFLRHSAMHLKTNVLLERIYESLYRAHRPLIFPNTFTLVNVTYKNIRSFGQSAAPPALVRSGALSFTFALSSTAKYDTNKPVSRIRNGNLVFWGPGIIQSNDFLTVNITQSQLQEAGLSNTVLVALKYLYAIVGGATKNYVKLSTNTEQPTSFGDLATLSSTALNVSMTQCFTKVPERLWQYNERMWQNAPNVLNRAYFTPMFLLYYVAYLIDDGYDDLEELRPFLIQGINDLEQVISYGTISITPQLYALLILLKRSTSSTKVNLRTTPERELLAYRDSLVARHAEDRLFALLADKEKVVDMLLTAQGRGRFRQLLVEEDIHYG